MKFIFTTISLLAALVAGPALAQTTVIGKIKPAVTEVQTDPDTRRGGAAGGATSGAIAGAAISERTR